MYCMWLDIKTKFWTSVFELTSLPQNVTMKAHEMLPYKMGKQLVYSWQSVELTADCGVETESNAAKWLWE